MAGATLRLADAESPAYDQLGNLGGPVGSCALDREIGSAGCRVDAVWDDYLNSGGEEGLLVFGTEEKRRDLLGRIGITLWDHRPGRGLRPRFELRYTQRASTADAAPGFDFSYSASGGP